MQHGHTTRRAVEDASKKQAATADPGRRPPDVSCKAVGCVVDALGRHVGDRARKCVALCQGGVDECADAKVADFGLARAVHQDVGWLDVSVHLQGKWTNNAVSRDDVQGSMGGDA